MTDNTELEYMYLNMDTGQFVDNQSELSKQLCEGALLRAMVAWKYSQVLIAGSVKHFTETEAIIKCRRLTGMMK